MGTQVDDTLLGRRLVFVTGKGGVGKTSVAAALAELSARHGKKTLVCEMDAKGALADALGVASLDFEPHEVEPNLFAMTMSTEDSLREYLRLFVKVPLIGKIGPLARTFDFVADAAPGVKEILAVGKVCHEVRERNYDLVVVDAEATGHIVAQIGAPRVIRSLVQVGLVRDQTDWMLDLLRDRDTTGVAVVTTPEEMPVTEALDLCERLPDETGVDIAAIVANRVLTPWFDDDGERIVGALAERDTAAHDTLVQAAGKHVTTVLDAAHIAAARRHTGDAHLERLADGAGDVPIIAVPELFTRATGRRVVTLVAEALDDHPTAGEVPDG